MSKGIRSVVTWIKWKSEATRQANENIREQPLKYEEPFNITPSDAFYFPAYLSENKATGWLRPRDAHIKKSMMKHIRATRFMNLFTPVGC